MGVPKRNDAPQAPPRRVVVAYLVASYLFGYLFVRFMPLPEWVGEKSLSGPAAGALWLLSPFLFPLELLVFLAMWLVHVAGLIF